MKKRETVLIVISAMAACICMGIVDAIIQPGYVIKSVIKIALFLGLPIFYVFRSKDGMLKRVIMPDKKGAFLALSAGIAVYALILAAYFIFRNIFDFSALTSSLTSTTGVDKANFLWVALYISFANSLLEEFFFRGYAFLNLKQLRGRRFAYVFSAAIFALYHIAMMIGWFDSTVIALALVGLFAGGLIFNWFDEKFGNIYMSWLVHMFANFATNTIGYILFNR